MRASADRDAAFAWEARIAQALRRARESLGASQADVAAELAAWGIEMHQTTLAKLEGGKRPIRLAELFALATLYGLTPGAVMLDAGSVVDAGDDIDERIVAAETTKMRLEAEFVAYAHTVFGLVSAAAEEKAALGRVLNAMASSGRERWVQRDGEHQAED